MGKKGTRDRQASMWVATADLPKSAGHPFYARLNRVLDDAGFDTFVEAQCAPFYADGIGRPSLAPGRDVRLLLLGYFEGLDSERAIAWRAADSLSIRQFLDFALHEAPPDHSTLSRTRRLIDVETHQAVFTWVLQRLADAHLVEGHTIGIDATTLEANAAMRSIVRRDTGEAYEAWLTRLADASGIATPTRAELARFDRKRKKKGSNEDWTHPHDPDAKITKMKDGRTHLAHTAEHAVDLETGAIVGVTVQDADAGDTTTMVETLIEAADQLAAVDGASGVAEVVGDKGYHSNETMVGCADLGVRSYVSEPDRGRRKWKGKAAAKKAVYANRRRIRGHRGQRLLRQRGELLERPNAHLYETGRMRRVHLRGHANILTRLLVHVCGANLGLLMRQLTGVGTPRSLQGRAAALLGALINLLGGLCERLKRSWAPEAPDAPDSSWGRPRQVNTNTRSSIYEEPLLPRAASGRPVQVLDPTAGGGSIPLEAVRLGFTAVANDLNNVATLLLAATVAHPSKYGSELLHAYGDLAREWRRRMQERLGPFFPPSRSTEEVDTTLIFARTIQCPHCGGLIPLSPNWRIAPGGVGIRLQPDLATRRCSFEVVQSAGDQSVGTVSRGSARCPFPDCGRVVDGDAVKRQAQAGGMGEQLFAVVFKKRLYPSFPTNELRE